VFVFHFEPIVFACRAELVKRIVMPFIRSSDVNVLIQVMRNVSTITVRLPKWKEY